MIVAHTCLREALWGGHGLSCQILTFFSVLFLSGIEG